ncbi:MAG: amino acid adenylation domain-containing protein [Gemmatimonadetes bacterium]|nr:amino acid adenylation domain-containing protein [Gemmatimonadota bacterium]
MIYLLHHLLPESASRFPDRTAVRFGEDRLTYADLEAQAGRLAAALVEAGVKKGDRVGIHFHKSARSVVAVFAVLKAGGIYVPLDPNSPRARIARIIEDCGIRHLIASQEKLGALMAGTPEAPAPALDAAFLVDSETAEPGTSVKRVVGWGEVEKLTPLAGPADGVDGDLSYILYTSGSTGIPKGVMISHRAAFAFVNWTHDAFGMSERDVVSNHAPLHFDLSIFDIFTTIKAGGTVVPVPERLSTFPVRLAEFIRDQRITCWYSVPSALTMMLLRGNLAKHSYPDLRLVLFAGEVFPVKYLREVMRCFRASFWNLFGPTETNVCTAYEVTELPEDRTEPVSIGKAIGNYDVFALNNRGEIAAVGEEGELYGRGPGIMSGYWGDVEKTDRVLVPNPLPAPFEERVVRTGDIVVLEADGNYTYRGRRDNMVKSRGYRIEIGEIETALYGHAKITEAAVVAIPDEEVTNRLKAYVVTDPPGALSALDVQQHCRSRVPKYMIPEMVEFRDVLPKTSTGKVDKQSLK